MKINYFDLGLYDGAEIDMFIDDVSKLNYDYSIYGFEAQPSFASKLQKKYNKNKHVHIHNLAIYNRADRIKLYLQNYNNGGDGNSIYSTKHNVLADSFVYVDSISIVDWIKENVADYETSYNILRFNIEGAELPLITDIINKNFVNNINLYLGSIVGLDILKVSEIKDKYTLYLDLLTQHNINILPYCYGLQPITDITTIIKEYYNENAN